MTATTDAQQALAHRAARAVGVALRQTREEAGRATEYAPREAESVLGRALHLLGAPVGAKHLDARLRLPTYLDAAPDRIRREFAQVCLLHRAQETGDASIFAFREERSDRYHRDLRAFLETVIGAPVTRSGHNINLSVEATEIVAEWPPVLPDPDRDRMAELAQVIQESDARIHIDTEYPYHLPRCRPQYPIDHTRSAGE